MPKQIRPFEENFADYGKEFARGSRGVIIDADFFTALAALPEIREPGTQRIGPGLGIHAFVQRRKTIVIPV